MSPFRNNPDLASQIKHRLNTLIVATVVLSLALIGIGFYALVEANKANDALCQFRQNLVNQIASTRDFVLHHPEGFAGIKPAQLLASANRQQQTVDSLSGLGCPEQP